jgi:outer membrane receptor protein involved in Fe transport
MKHLSIVFALVFTSATLAVAGTTGKIAGEVKDSQTGEPVIGANIIVEGTTAGAATNIEGYFVILNLPPGKYNVVASAIGYNKRTLSSVSVSVDLTTKVDFSLVQTVLESGEEVVITAERPIIKRDLTSSEARVDASTIETIPVNEVSEVLSLQAGITTDKGGGIHIRGGRTSEVAYWVDGVSISDGFDHSQAVQVDNGSIQELQVISGTFNAEYGQAMSGIVNIVTKDGSQAFHGSVSAYVGSYVTSDGGQNSDRQFVFDQSAPPPLLGDAIYYNLNKVRPFSNRNLEGSLAGPVPGTPLTFYVSGRYFKSEGWLYGNHVFNNDGSLDFSTVKVIPLSRDSVLLTLGDNPRAMNGRARYSGQVKLTWQVAGDMKFTLSGIGSRIDFKDFSHDYKLIPDADVNKYDRNYHISGQWAHSFSPSSFYTINLSFLNKSFREYLYEYAFDPRYIVNPDPLLTQKNIDEFNKFGTNNHRFYRNTETRAGKIDYTDQVSKLHLLKAGVEAKLHRLYLEDFNLTYNEVSPGRYLPALPPDPLTSPNYDDYTVTPLELSGYVQDKLEYENMIVNLGIRFDYFNSKGSVLSDETITVQTPDGPARIKPINDPNVYNPQTSAGKALTLSERLSRWYKKASAKSSISPRFGISYPITDKGVLHFSYGHFLQIPSFDKLYQKPAYKVPISTGLVSTTYGNSDLNAEKTVQYEIGLQQQLSDVLSLDVTGFYKDTRDWVTSSPQIYVGESADGSAYSYSTYVNQDYANTRGITLTVNRRPSGLFSMNFSYTFQTAEGVNSNADEALAGARSNNEPAQSLTPLEWDQTHTANLTLGFGREDWGAFLIGRYGSGLPYTPAVSQAEDRGQDAQRAVTKNSRRRPANYTIDLRLFKNVVLEPLNISFYLKVFNLFDRRNEIDTYGQTGRATATAAQLGLASITGAGRLNSVDAYLVRPDYYSEPREIQFGIEINY